MSEVSVDEVTIKLTRTEAIDVGCAIKERLINTAKGGYDIDKNYPNLIRLCIQLLTVASGADWSDQVYSEINKATPPKDTL
jgi:hypothetical protein